MWAQNVYLTDVIFAVLGAFAVMLVTSWYLGRSFLKNVVVFCAGYVFLLALYSMGVGAAAWAMIALTGIVALGGPLGTAELTPSTSWASLSDVTQVHGRISATGGAGTWPQWSVTA